jgi:hypothetical protein
MQGDSMRMRHWPKQALIDASFVFVDILSGRVYSSNLLSLISINAPCYHTRASNFLRVDFHRRTYYGVYEPLNGAVQSFNEFDGLSTFI